MIHQRTDYSPGQARGGFRWWHSISIRTPQGLWDEALCQSIFTLRPGNPEGLSYYRTLFILFPAWGGHSQPHLLFMLCSFKFNSTVQYRSFRRKYATAYMTRMSYPKFRFFVLCVSCISTGREIFASIRFGKVIVLIVFACMHKHLPVCPAAQVCWQLYVFY